MNGVLFASLAAMLAVAASAQGVVSLDIEQPPVPRLLNRRRDLGSYSQLITNNITVKTYFAKVTVGTPPQPISLAVDTGSSDTWVIDERADGCEKKNPCITPFSARGSSTVTLLDNAPFNIKYGDNSTVSGSMMKDTLTIGGAAIKNLEMGHAHTVIKVNSGILGLGLRAGETPNGNYPNVMDLFYDQGLIGTKAFSLYLNAQDSPTGNLLFGGIDKAKFTGDLLAVPLLPSSATRKVSSYYVALSSLSMTFDNGTNQNLTFADSTVLLDSGASFTYLPNSTVTRLYQALGVAVREDPNQGVTWIDCGILDSQRKATVDFRFGGDKGPLVRVPMSQMVLDLRQGSSSSKGDLDSCLFGVLPTANDDQVHILGDTFLRSAYVVYDLANQQVALAQAKPNATANANKSDVVEFGKDATTIPGLAGDAMRSATGVPTVTVTASDGGMGATATDAVGKKNAASVSRSAPTGADLLTVGLMMFWTAIGLLTGSTWICLQL
ncbi:aspartic peptidase domain-containing protein [Apiospora arundinis]|uniref:Aspartic peptidase domain-containing protein n=1 Tax=Apiospora arundinis TaxID=335852 RepID=A0ABR2HRR1_9PEZI